MNDFGVFRYDRQKVRIFQDENRSLWWALVDVCRALDLGQQQNVANRLNDDEKKVIRLRPTCSVVNSKGGGATRLIVVNERGLNHAVNHLDSSELEKFRKWKNTAVSSTVQKDSRVLDEDVPIQAPKTVSNGKEIMGELFALGDDKRSGIDSVTEFQDKFVQRGAMEADFNAVIYSARLDGFCEGIRTAFALMADGGIGLLLEKLRRYTA